MTTEIEEPLYLVAVLLPDGGRSEPQLVRCSVVLEACRAFAGQAGG